MQREEELLQHSQRLKYFLSGYCFPSYIFQEERLMKLMNH